MIIFFTKPCVIMYLGNIHNMSLVPVTFRNFFFSNPPKMTLFGLNWEESKWPVHFCYIMLHFFASKIGVKLPLEKKSSLTLTLSRGSNYNFFQKNAFFGQKRAFFQKVHFIQKCSVTQNTIFQCIKFFFVIQSKVNIFHQIQPIDDDRDWLYYVLSFVWWYHIWSFVCS